MGQLIIVTGKTGSGKQAWIEKWVDADPNKRVHARNLAGAIKALEMGLDCAMEISLGDLHGIRVEVIA